MVVYDKVTLDYLARVASLVCKAPLRIKGAKANYKTVDARVVFLTLVDRYLMKVDDNREDLANYMGISRPSVHYYMKKVNGDLNLWDKSLLDKINEAIDVVDNLDRTEVILSRIYSLINELDKAQQALKKAITRELTKVEYENCIAQQNVRCTCDVS